MERLAGHEHLVHASRRKEKILSVDALLPNRAFVHLNSHAHHLGTVNLWMRGAEAILLTEPGELT